MNINEQEIREATASEPLSLDEEYNMQRSWRTDADKLTFIVCLPWSGQSSSAEDRILEKEADAEDRMIGDVNLFLRQEEEDDDNGDYGDHAEGNGEKNSKIIGEVELMIAEKQHQRHGYGRAALLTFLRYIALHRREIAADFLHREVSSDDNADNGRDIDCLSVKIGQTNHRSLALFESTGFVKVSDTPNYFGEFELRLEKFERGHIEELCEKYRITTYEEIQYR